MKILIVTQHFWPEEFLINSTAVELASAGHDVTVLTGQPNYPDGDIYDGYKATNWGRSSNLHKVEVFRVPLIPRRRGKAINLIFNYLSFIALGILFAPFVLRGKKFDVIFVYATSPIFQAIVAIWLRLFKRAPVAIWVQDLWPDVLAATGMIKNGTVLKAINRAVVWVYNRADLLLAQSKSIMAEVKRQCPTGNVGYHPNPGIELLDSSKSTDLGLTNCFSVMFAGNLGRAQALQTIVDAAEILKHDKSIVFVIVGSGSEFQMLEKAVKEKELNIRLTGPFPRAEMKDILSQPTALLLTLTDNPTVSKTIPSKLQTYMSIGKPVLGAINGESADLIQEAKAGYVGPAEDAVHLSENILKLKSDGQNAWNEFGKNGQDYFDQHFRSERLNDSLIEQFEELVRKKTRKHIEKGS